jgi:hypothetical protein
MVYPVVDTHAAVTPVGGGAAVSEAASPPLPAFKATDHLVAAPPAGWTWPRRPRVSARVGTSRRLCVPPDPQPFSASSNG